MEERGRLTLVLQFVIHNDRLEYHDSLLEGNEEWQLLQQCRRPYFLRSQRRAFHFYKQRNLFLKKPRLIQIFNGYAFNVSENLRNFPLGSSGTI